LRTNDLFGHVNGVAEASRIPSGEYLMNPDDLRNSVPPRKLIVRRLLWLVGLIVFLTLFVEITARLK
jgi:hypothetical protein